MAAEIGQAERPGFEDEQPENATAFGWMATAAASSAGIPTWTNSDSPSPRSDNPEGPVAGTDDLDGGAEHIAQDVGQRQVWR